MQKNAKKSEAPLRFIPKNRKKKYKIQKTETQKDNHLWRNLSKLVKVQKSPLDRLLSMTSHFDAVKKQAGGDPDNHDDTMTMTMVAI